MKTQSIELPTTRRWQSGFEIPINIEAKEKQHNEFFYIVYEYDRIIVEQLDAKEIELALQMNFVNDPDALKQAIDAAKTNPNFEI